MLEHNPIYKAIVNYKREFKEGMFRAVSCSDLFLTLSESHYLFLFCAYGSRCKLYEVSYVYICKHSNLRVRISQL